MDSIKSILNTKPDQKNPPKYQWQQTALDIIEFLEDGETKKSSIFKCCKDNERIARIAFADIKELNKPHSLYFLKAFNNQKKI